MEEDISAHSTDIVGVLREKLKGEWLDGYALQTPGIAKQMKMKMPVQPNEKDGLGPPVVHSALVLAEVNEEGFGSNESAARNEENESDKEVKESETKKLDQIRKLQLPKKGRKKVVDRRRRQGRRQSQQQLSSEEEEEEETDSKSESSDSSDLSDSPGDDEDSDGEEAEKIESNSESSASNEEEVVAASSGPDPVPAQTTVAREEGAVAGDGWGEKMRERIAAKAESRSAVGPKRQIVLAANFTGANRASDPVQEEAEDTTFQVRVPSVCMCVCTCVCVCVCVECVCMHACVCMCMYMYVACILIILLRWFDELLQDVKLMLHCKSVKIN